MVWTQEQEQLLAHGTNFSKPNYAGVSDMVVEVQTDGCTYVKTFSLNEWLCCLHNLTLLLSLSFTLCLCQHNARRSYWKVVLFSATLELLVVSYLCYRFRLSSCCPSGLWVGFSLTQHQTTRALP